MKTSLILFLLIIAPHAAMAAINRCVDVEGRVLLTDEPCYGMRQAAEDEDLDASAYTRFWNPRPVPAKPREPRRGIVAPNTNPAVPPLPPAPGMKAWPPWRN